MATTLTTQRPNTPEVTALGQAETWKQQTVGDFFARCNWENVEIPALEAASPGQALDYRLSVGQFFGAIPWDGETSMSPMTTSRSMAQGDAASELPSFEEQSASDQLPDVLPDLAEIADESHLDGGDVTLGDFLDAF